MCGLIGFVDPGLHTPPARWSALISSMTDAIEARGPDREGHWSDEEARIALGFRRLSILDLSSAGDQPMISACGRYVLVFNGEIYNCRPLRAELNQQITRQWRGHSDTETLLEALAHWGMEAVLSKLDGMFAFALWDRKTRTLSLARDRFGEKPLCYGLQNGVFLFGSTLAALRPHPAYTPTLDVDATAAFFSRGYVPAPLTIQRGMSKLQPGQWAQIVFDGTPKPHMTLHTFFDARLAAEQQHGANAQMLFDDAVETLDTLVAQSVESRLHADVPVGVFLSGGIDSSIVAAHAAKQSGTRISTFTISFPESNSDEAPFARNVAHHLGTDHHEMPVTDRDARDLVPSIPSFYDEPFADPSAVPSMVLSAKTRSAVTVALSGDGGDEFFGGYPRYVSASNDWNPESKIPWPIRDVARRIADVPGIPAQKQFALMGATNLADVYTPHVSRWRRAFPLNIPRPTASWSASPLEAEAQFMVHDTQHYLPDGLQVKMDRASMGNGLEVRAPLLNETIARFAWSLPLAHRIHPVHGGKYVLRRTLARHVPEHLFERPKAGFYQPLPEWLRGDLRDWAENLLSPAALSKSGLINVPVVRKAWREHLRGRNRALDLWTVLMFQQWLAVHA